MSDGRPWTFANFRIRDILDVDLVSTTYRATTVDGDESRRLRVFSGDGVDDRVQAAVLAEALEARRVRHPHILAIHHADREGDRAYVVSDDIHGAVLRDFIPQHHPVKASTVLAMAWQLAEALDAVHARGVVHGSINPHTIWVADSPGRDVPMTYLTGFGAAMALARHASSRNGAPTSDDLLYVEPEQVRDGRANPEADRYALACAVYHLMTGAPPFRRGTVNAQLGAHRFAAVEPPSSVRDDLPPALDSVFARALAKEPSDRYPSASALLIAVERGLRGQVEARAPETTGGAGLLFGRRTTEPFAVERRPATEPPSAAEVRPAPAVPEPVTPAPGGGDVAAPDLSERAITDPVPWMDRGNGGDHPTADGDRLTGEGAPVAATDATADTPPPASTGSRRPPEHPASAVTDGAAGAPATTDGVPAPADGAPDGNGAPIAGEREPATDAAPADDGGPAAEVAPTPDAARAADAEAAAEVAPASDAPRAAAAETAGAVAPAAGDRDVTSADAAGPLESRRSAAQERGDATHQHSRDAGPTVTLPPPSPWEPSRPRRLVQAAVGTRPAVLAVVAGVLVAVVAGAAALVALNGDDADTPLEQQVAADRGGRERPATVRPLWATAAGGQPVRSITATEDAVVVDAGATISALDPTSGTRRWSERAPAEVTGVAVLHGVVAVSTADGISAYDVDTGRLRWEETGAGTDDAAVVAGDGTFLVAARDDTGIALSAIDPRDGVVESLAAIGTDAAGGRRGRLALAFAGESRKAGSTLYVLTRAALYAVDAEAGFVRWRAPVRDSGRRETPRLRAQPWVRSLGVAPGAVLVADRDGMVCRHAAASGDQVWTTCQELPSGLDSAPTLLTGGGRVVVAGGGAVATYDFTTGAQLWRRAAGDGRTGPAVAAGAGLVYALQEDGGVAALDSASGRERWRAPDVKGVTTLAADGDGVFAGLADGNVVRLVERTVAQADAQ